MNPLPGLLWLQAETDGGAASSFFQSPLPMLVLIFFIFYFLLIRPQQRKQRKQENMLKSIERGDQVVTSGGLHGKVTGVTDDVLTVEIAALKGERVRVKVTKGRIESVEKPKSAEKPKKGEDS